MYNDEGNTFSVQCAKRAQIHTRARTRAHSQLSELLQRRTIKPYDRRTRILIIIIIIISRSSVVWFHLLLSVSFVFIQLFFVSFFIFFFLFWNSVEKWFHNFTKIFYKWFLEKWQPQPDHDRSAIVCCGPIAGHTQYSTHCDNNNNSNSFLFCNVRLYACVNSVAGPKSKRNTF